MDKVFWMDLHSEAGSSLEEKFVRLLKKAGIDERLSKGALVAIKVHVGERGNLGYVNHNYARLVVGMVSACGAKPFLTDTNTLYSGGRHNAVDHANTAVMHGYSSGTAGAPFLAADGLRGLDFEELPVKGRHFRAARIAGAICKADRLVMLSHFKGHGEMGFGGTIKNLGMGCAAIPGKLELHSSVKPLSKSEACIGCGQCVRCCPEHAIAMRNRKAIIDYDRCVGCGQCVAACNYGAMNVQWESHGEVLLEKVGEYAATVSDHFAEKALYVNFAVDISPDCDCWNFNDAPIAGDVGIFVSTNPLALDRATLDSVNSASSSAGAKKKNNNIFDGVHENVRSEYIFEYCRQLGMNDEYTLDKVV